MLKITYEYICTACGAKQTIIREADAQSICTGCPSSASSALPAGWRVAIGELICPAHRVRLAISNRDGLVQMRGDAMPRGGDEDEAA